MTSAAKTFEGHTIFARADGVWAVGALVGNNIAVYDTERYASEATAVLEAKRRHTAKPFMNYIPTRVG